MAGPLIALLLVGAVVVTLEPSAGEVVGFLGILTGMTTAGILFVRRSRNLASRERSAWRALGVAVFLVASGVLMVGVLTEAGVDLPTFGALDIFFLAGYGMFVVALTKLARAEGDGPDWILVLLDALVGAIALIALVWTAFYAQLLEAVSNAPWWQAVIAFIYPVLDVAAIIALMILVMRRSQFRLDLRLAFLVIGLFFQVTADFMFLNAGLGSTFAEAEPIWVLNLVATAFLVASAAIVDLTPRKRVFPEANTPIWALVWPYLLAGALLGVHVARYRALDPGLEEIILLDAVLAVGAVIFIRQIVVIHRNQVKVDQQRSEIVGSVSHELRTPLTAILGYLSLMDDDPDGFPEGAKREMIGEATDQARHMSRLVSDLLMLAKGGNRKLGLEVRKTTLVNVVTSTLQVLEPGQTTVEADLQRDAALELDPDRIQQALGNLLSNAVRYGGDRVELVAVIEADNLTLEVHDDGPGVPTRYETLVWQRFERGAHRLDATTPGLGIGLAIVRAVAEAHDGSASYRRSERLGGACFGITLPGSVLSQTPQTSPVGTSG